MYSEHSLEIAGYKGKVVPNTFLRQEDETDRLAVIFPGYTTSVDMPPLYYATEILLECRRDVLLVQYDYRSQPTFTLPLANREYEWIEADALAAVSVPLSQRSYRELILVGQSLGTVAMAGVLSFDTRFVECRCVWLAPLLNDSWVYERILKKQPQSVFVIGEEDRHYDPQKVEQLLDALDAESLIIASAGHDFQIPGQLRETIFNVEKIVALVAGFVGCAEFL